MSPMRPSPCSSNASSTLSPAAGKKEKTKKPAGAREPPKRRSFPCKVCGKRFPSQQAMAGHCSGHTRASGAARTTTTAARQLHLSPSPLPLPMMVVTMHLAVLWPLAPLQHSLPPSKSGWRPPGSSLSTCSVQIGDDAFSTTSLPASAIVDATLRLGRQGMMDGGDDGRKKGKGQMDGLDLELRLHP
ncbi:hypothetical protein E2562_033315 [Oryza meyeriana var. granulata]|uniref:C2H2-type domain-containing protein n=1 Tax=Oryza meyeriana var. granulata TaxID=110450 RepID=A0A6G1F0V4_9ORYZ|nr:hypothetical protein E2562_033315 [Oryza meyeriana var. granulata]